MSPAREDILREAEAWAARLRADGYPDAEVLPEYCIGNEIGSDRIFTRTVAIHVGEYRQPPRLLDRLRELFLGP